MGVKLPPPPRPPSRLGLKYNTSNLIYTSFMPKTALVEKVSRESEESNHWITSIT